MALKLLFTIGILSVFSISSAFAVEYLPMFNQKNYSIGESIVITLEDQSKNTLPGRANSLEISVESDSQPEGKKIILVETGLDTGVFSGKIKLSSYPSVDSLYVKEGDSIHAMYLSYIKTATVKSDFDIYPILVSTDKQDYKVGEIIVISGSVSQGNTLYDVNLSLQDPHGNIIHSEKIDLSYVRSFTTTINTENTGWTNSGNYKILIWHESEENFAESTFSLSSTYGKEKTGNSLNIFNSNINLDYSTSSGKITIVKADSEKNSLIFSLGTTAGGHLTVKLPRYIMDSQNENGDEKFTILMDDRESAYIEKINPNERTLTIPYESDTKRLEIVGTFLDLEPSTPVKSSSIPEWVRNNAEWWSKGLIEEDDFVFGVEYLINQGVIQIPITYEKFDGTNSEFVPAWIKDNAGWWSDGLITDDEFVNGLEYLVSKGIISV